LAIILRWSNLDSIAAFNSYEKNIPDIDRYFAACAASVAAQTNPEDIALANDEFQNLFYESLTQKGIENYDKAVVALEKCLKMQPNNDFL
jgi:hypothetical protein